MASFRLQPTVSTPKGFVVPGTTSLCAILGVVQDACFC